MTIFERLVIAAAAGAVSGGVTFVLGGSQTLVLVLAGLSFVLTLVLKDLVAFFGWDG